VLRCVIVESSGIAEVDSVEVVLMCKLQVIHSSEGEHTEQICYANPWHNSNILLSNDSLFHLFVIEINRL
jgi:hypothetical protein